MVNAILNRFPKNAKVSYPAISTKTNAQTSHPPLPKLSMIPLHTAPGTRSNLFSSDKSLKQTLTSLPSTLLKSLKPFFLSVPSKLSSNPILFLCIFFLLTGTWWNRRYSWSHSFNCSASTENNYENKCTLSTSTYWNRNSADLWSDYDGIIKCSPVRVDPKDDRFYKNVDGLTRKERRRLKHSYLLTKEDPSDPSSSPNSGPSVGTSKSGFVMGKRGVGRKKAMMKCNAINRYFDGLNDKSALESLDGVNLEIKESKGVTAFGVLCYVGGGMCAIWGIIVWSLKEEVEERKRR